MSNVIKKPLVRTDTPDGPLYATEVDGVVVHGGKALTMDEHGALRAIVAAAKRHLAKATP